MFVNEIITAWVSSWYLALMLTRANLRCELVELAECCNDTYLPRALKEWLKDLAARCRRVCRKTSTFRGLKLSPSSARTKHKGGVRS